ncbi:Protein of unknown function DUF58 [Anaerobranca californiensis DSM 14826]|uniref:DUF58 domain-containing protein n=1 Tax=Anaerobranca californiensis DSM 14826 TaxID=1120989 RepID=A0A1M6PVW7_9FIRM|nr:DUF58 domain-containing protein [Anaerobranca californiensis]SHK12050.1 Protein of unknown function DUF58 [Anaerobranca californiensis DSM 14826]
MEIKFKREIYLLITLVVLLFFWAGVMEDSRVANLFWLGLLMTVTPFLTLIRGWRGIKVERLLPEGRIFSGDKLRIKLNIKNNSIFPILWLKVLERYPLKYMIKHQTLSEISVPVHFLTKKGTKHEYLLQDVPRGKLKWDKVELYRTDLLGFVETKKELPLLDEVTVYPKFVYIPVDNLYNRDDEKQGVTKLIKGNDYSQISGVREYQRGDKLSLIHWKVSAKKNTLMSKEFYPLLNQENHIILDCYRKNYGEDYDPQFELAVSVAASLINSLGRFNKNLTLKFNNKSGDVVTYKNKTYFIKEAMEKLALVEHDGYQTLEKMLNEQYSYWHRGVTLFIITNRLDDKLIGKFYQGNGKGRIKVFLVGGEKFGNYDFIKGVKSLKDLSG